MAGIPAILLLALMAMVAVPTWIYMEFHDGKPIDAIVDDRAEMRLLDHPHPPIAGGRFVLWVEVAPGDVRPVEDWIPSEETHAICLIQERVWQSLGVYAECGEEF